MGFAAAVEWLEQWQLRILVLGSLYLQYFLFVAAALRKRNIPAWFRFLTWLAYQGSDALAMYALAALFNHQREQGSTTTSDNLEVLWAPVLLLHLGGHDGITAYNIEDNELWKRRVVISASQVAVVIYIFCKTWSHDKEVLHLGMLLFLPGIHRCLENPWALKSATFKCMVRTVLEKKRYTFLNERSLGPEATVAKDGSNYPLGKFLDSAKECWPARPANGAQSMTKEDRGTGYERTALFADIAYSYAYRLKRMKKLLALAYPGDGEKFDVKEVQRRMQHVLCKAFDRFYTRDRRDAVLLVHVLRVVAYCLIFAAIILFHRSHKEAYNGADVKTTYILLYFTAALDLLLIGSVKIIDSERWPDRVAQYNLVWYWERNTGTRAWLIRKLATLVVSGDYLDEVWCMKPCDCSRDITKLVFDHVEDGWKSSIHDAESYRSFNDGRGRRTLEKAEQPGLEAKYLTMPFDESVLLWHIATHLCVHYGGVSRQRQVCDEMSNYMAYLLAVNPEMLMTGTRRSLFRAAYGELSGVLRDHRELPREKGELEKLIDEKKDALLISRAWKLANSLLALGNEEMWRVVQGVWVEMLCYSASTCRGYLHTKSMGGGGEYLSYVWLLLSHMGMETLPDRLQRTELKDPPAKGDQQV